MAKSTNLRLSHLENYWIVKRRQTQPNLQAWRMQRTSVNTQTQEPKCSSGVQTQGEKNSTKTMRKNPRRWRWSGR